MPKSATVASEPAKVKNDAFKYMTAIKDFKPTISAEDAKKKFPTFTLKNSFESKPEPIFTPKVQAPVPTKTAEEPAKFNTQAKAFVPSFSKK